MEDIQLEQSEKITQYIVINLEKEQYGIDIQYIDNISRMMRMTRVPNVQDYIMGVVNLRGEVIPVISLRKKIGLEDDIVTKNSRIIIVKMNNEEMIGILVDEVKEVINLTESEIQPIVKANESKYVSGVGKQNGQLVSLLDLNLLLS